MKYNEIEKWLIKNGWKIDIYEETRPSETARNGTVYERRLTLTKYNGDFYKTKTWARYDHTYRKVTDRWGYNNQSNWYSFYCYGKNKFKVENNISFRQFTVDQIESALKVVGLNK